LHNHERRQAGRRRQNGQRQDRRSFQADAARAEIRRGNPGRRQEGPGGGHQGLRQAQGRRHGVGKVGQIPAADPNPGKILCIGLNYRKHAEETGSPIPAYPVVFCRFDNTLVPHNGKMPRPTASDQLDWEAELTIVIGKKCRNVPKEKALGVIAGYACFNDGSVRDWQMKSGGQFTLGKNFDGTGGFGPDIVTSDELPPGAAPLRIMTRVNGEVMQDSNTDDLIFDVPTLVHELSKVMTLDPGDIIITGTPSGVAMARNPQPWLKPGDVCEVEIEKIGVLRNPIVQGA
jgi:2-keto-4-pentenoate hydratase/2-oxohepta-3-ene-1,7-dioic acid hydratase in catechol pathway